MSTKPPATSVRPSVPDKGPPPEPVDVTHVNGCEVATVTARIVIVAVATVVLTAAVATWIIHAKLEQIARICAAR